MTAGDDLRATARRLEAGERQTGRAVGKAVNKIALDTGRRVAGADGALGSGGHRKRPIRLRTKTRIYPQPVGIEVIVWAVPAGAWRWIQDGTRPHKIRRRRRGPRARMTVDHPGMAGFGVWDRAEREAQSAVPKLFFVAVERAVR